MFHPNPYIFSKKIIVHEKTCKKKKEAKQNLWKKSQKNKKLVRNTRKMLPHNHWVAIFFFMTQISKKFVRTLQRGFQKVDCQNTLLQLEFVVLILFARSFFWGCFYKFYNQSIHKFNRIYFFPFYINIILSLLLLPNFVPLSRP